VPKIRGNLANQLLFWENLVVEIIPATNSGSFARLRI
jgi:hypothetical protein